MNLISVIYIPPNSCEVHDQLLHNYLSNFVNESSPSILVGALNAWTKLVAALCLDLTNFVTYCSD